MNAKLSSIVTILIVILGSLNFSISSYAEEDKRKDVSASVKTQVIALLTQNEKIHAAMFEYNKKALKSAVKKFQGLVTELKVEEFKKTLAPALKASGELLSNEKKEQDNESYHRLSLALVKLVETYKLGGVYNVYYCPMVKKRWVQNSEKMRKVHNPYAPEMPHCGGQITEF